MHPLARRTPLDRTGYGTTTGGPAAVVSLDRCGNWNGCRSDYAAHVLDEPFVRWAKPVHRENGTIVLVNLEFHDERYLVKASRHALFVISVGVDEAAEWPHADLETLWNFIEFDKPLAVVRFGEEVAVFDSTLPADELLRDGRTPLRRAGLLPGPADDSPADVLLWRPEPGIWDVYGFFREEAHVDGGGAAFLFRSE